MSLGRLFRRQSSENLKSKALAEQLRKELLEAVEKLDGFSHELREELGRLETVKDNQGD